MKLFKLFTSCLLLAIVALFFWQNLPAFQAPVPFQLNLYLRQPWSWTLSQCTLLIFPWPWFRRRLWSDVEALFPYPASSGPGKKRQGTGIFS